MGQRVRECERATPNLDGRCLSCTEAHALHDVMALIVTGYEGCRDRERLE
jgi:hypothetical protein